MLKAFKIIGNILFVIIVLVLSFFIVVNAVVPKKAVNIVGFKSYKALSDSMKPKFNRGDLIVVTSKKFEKLEVGDVITFVNPLNKKDIVTHELVEKQTDKKGVFLITKGINNPNRDPFKIYKDDYIGVFKSRVVKLGFVLGFFTSLIGVGTILVLSVFLYGIILLIKKYKFEKAINNNKTE